MASFLRNLPRGLRPLGLGAWLALAFSLLSVVLTLLLVEVVERAATAHLKTSIGRTLGQMAMQAADKLDRGMYERYREVKLIAQRGDLIGPNVDNAARRRVLDRMRDTYTYYDWIGMASVEGKVQVAAGGLLEGADVSKRPWFQNALRGIYVGDVHEAVLLAKLLPRDGDTARRFVDVAFPYFDADGKPLGVFGVHLAWQWARDIERSVVVPMSGQGEVEAMIVSRDGLVLDGPPDLLGETVAAQPSLRAARDNGYLVETWPDGKSYLVGFSKTSGRYDYPGLGWTVVLRQQVDNAYLPVKRLREHALWSGAALAVLFSLAGLLVARRITRPLNELARSAQRIQRGEMVPLAATRDSYFEVRALSGSLSALVADLVHRRQELQDLNTTLERRVEERTRELEAALVAVRASEQRIGTIVEASQDAFIGVDLNGTVTDWNSAAERMFGWRRKEAVGWPLVELVVPERFRDSARRAIRLFRETGQHKLLARHVERIVVNRAGVEFPIEMTAGLAGSGDGAFFSVFLHDISERKKIERMKSEFVSTVSHELRTPLTSIRASLSMLADGTAGDLPQEIKSLVAIAHDSCERLVRLVNDVLDIQKIESGNMRFERTLQPLLPLAEHALDAMEGYAGQMGVALRCESGPGAQALAVNCDRDRIVQVLTNLLSNAVKFSPRGGLVTLGVGHEGGRARLTVSDQGCGIPEEFRPRVFERFAQADSADSRQKGGTGLGLSITKSIVDEHGGTIWFESQAGAGTRFIVELPLARRD